MKNQTDDQQPNSSTNRAWLQALMLRDPGRWSSRLGVLVSWLKTLGRGQRRRFARASAGLVAGASGIALMALLAGPMAPPVQAAAITVGNSGCTSLVDAIKAANTGTTVNSCTGSGSADTITLAKNITLDVSYAANANGNGDTGLPAVVTPITINGAGFTIERSTAGGTPNFRLFDVGSGGDLTLSNVTLSNGYAYQATFVGAGGAVYVMSGGSLTLDGATISSNKASLRGGGIYAKSGTVTVTNSTITGNTTKGSGGGIGINDSTLTVTGSNIDGNDISPSGFTTTGGGVWLDYSEATFDDSSVSENVTNWRGAGIYGTYSTLTVTNGSIISGNLTLADNGSGPAISMWNSAVIFTDSSSINNEGTGGNVWGGGMLVSADSNRDKGPRPMLIVDNSIISGNVTDVGGGGIYATYLYDLRITNSTVSQNDGYQNGGGIYVSYIYGGVISNTIVESNLALSGYGGGVFLYYADVQIVDSLIADNQSYYNGGGIGVYYGVTAVISGTTITGNRSTDFNGGGIGVYGSNNDITVINSTISNNTANFYGGGIYTSGNGYDDDSLTVIHTTVTGNDTGDGGGGIYAGGGTVTIEASIVSGNTANSGYEVYQAGSSTVTANYSVLGDSTHDGATAFYGTINFGTGTILATSDDNNIDLGDIIEPTLADNGGLGTLPGGDNTPTHMIVDGSPAIDIILGGSCAVDIDQLGEPRPSGDGCDAGAVELQAGAGDAMTFISTWAFGSLEQNPAKAKLNFTQLDILAWDGEEWTKWFDGMAAGLNPDAYKPGSRWKHNINAMSISDVDAGDVYMSFTQNDEPVPGIPGRVNGMDIVFWDGEAEEWSLVFKGNLKNVGLTNKTQEKIDGLHVLADAPEWSEFAGDDCEAYFLISTQGPGIVPKPGNVKPKNVMKFSGEDVLGFCATNLGINTTGFWEMVLDGSAQRVVKNNIDSISMNEDETVMYVASKKAFSVDDAFGGHSMVFAFDLRAKAVDGEFSGPYLRFMDDLGIQPNVDALHVTGELELP